MIADLVTVLEFFLRGELTSRFLAKAPTVIINISSRTPVLPGRIEEPRLRCEKSNAFEGIGTATGAGLAIAISRDGPSRSPSPPPPNSFISPRSFYVRASVLASSQLRITQPNLHNQRAGFSLGAHSQRVKGAQAFCAFITDSRPLPRLPAPTVKFPAPYTLYRIALEVPAAYDASSTAIALYFAKAMGTPYEVTTQMQPFKIRRSLHSFGAWSRFVLTACLFAIPAIFSTASAQVILSVAIAPPELPVYAQPTCPAEGYIWTPGYWSYSDDGGYFWVPGTW